MNLKKIAISIGDLNGIGIEIILRTHSYVKTICKPYYCINETLLAQAVKLLNMKIPNDFVIVNVKGAFNISPGLICEKSGQYSFDSFVKAVSLVEDRDVNAIVTLPIHKEAWSLANIPFKGHTHYLRSYFKKDAIMMLGCEELFVALFTEHTALSKVSPTLDLQTLKKFFINFYNATHFKNIGVLGLNPHAGDNGVFGNEEKIIIMAIAWANKKLNKKIFHGPLAADSAFTPFALNKCNRIIAMYHDQGLAPLKALYFDQSINISLCLPILRTSVDHGTAFDIAYKNNNPKIQSYINAIKMAINSEAV